jgi:integrase
LSRGPARPAGLPEELSHPHPHALRHAAGYFLIIGEVDVRFAKEFLGHKTPAMTMHYTAVSPRRLQALRVR